VSMWAPMSRQRVKTVVRFTWRTFSIIHQLYVPLGIGLRGDIPRSNHCQEIVHSDAVAGSLHNSLGY
jgi:hypothetical protein